MKKIIISLLACYTPFIVTATEIVIPDVELGHWVTTSDTSGLLEQALASVPEESRAMVRQMMEDQMSGNNSSDECVSKSTLDNFATVMKKSFGDDQDCDMTVIESNKEKLVLTMICSAATIEMETLFISNKLTKSSVVTNLQGMPSTTINTTSKWISSDCPENI